METPIWKDNPKQYWYSLTFNFLASLINGNWILFESAGHFRKTFNFLASLINGNRLCRNLQAPVLTAFNFLASLINGNDKMWSGTSNKFFRFF